MRIAVLGVGLIGGSIGLAARERARAEVVGWGPRRKTLETALALGAVDRVAPNVEDAVADADAVFACAPVELLPELVAQALAAAGPDTVVTDAGSTKRNLVDAIDDERFVGGHPIAGAETAGVENARVDLFDGAAWYLTPRADTSGILFERLHRLLVAFGARPSAIDAQTHDRMLAAVSHLPHVLANVLVTQAASDVADDEPLPRTGPSFRDVTRVAGANSEVWTGIYLSNRDAIAYEVDAVIERLAAVADWLRSADAEALRTWNDSAREDRRRLLEAGLQGGSVTEMRLSVPNRPGIVAQVALALGKAGVNIADMALSPAPDMRSGSMTLWIAGDDDAERAKQLIVELGFPAAVVEA
ncbi:MAG TPA: prephenate dehydrogenase/arogenate dehydrogenase family protein [Thermoleophilaceae bacterium]|jgi:prephenate dehydrogenase|nr:prephenate dehydrogenase/arogenate dehydrogenase family protein [Thermoleophilaceae bacterium]